MFRAVDVGALVPGLIGPRLHAVAVLLVILPATLVNGSVVMQILALTVGLIVGPLTLVDIAIRVDQAANAVSFAVAPLALVQRAVEPDLTAFASPGFHVCLPLANIDCSTGQTEGSLQDESRPCDVFKVRHLERTVLLVYLFDRFILEQVAFIDAVIELAVFSPVLQCVANLVQAFAHHVGPKKRLDLDDALDEGRHSAILSHS